MTRVRRKVYPFTRRNTIEEQFADRWEPVTESGCWIWTGSLNQQGYGRIWFQYQNLGAHRVSYELHKGPIPEGKIICHKCNTPACVNPDHLYAGTPATNMQDAIRSGRFPSTAYAAPRGEAASSSKLTDEAVIAIRQSTESNTVLAKRYGISSSHMSRVRRGLCWSHL